MMGWNDNITKIKLPTTYLGNEVNVFLLKGETISLIDAGHNIAGSWDLFIKQLNSHGYNVKDIKQIIITHHHLDHIGLVKYFDHDVMFIGHPDCERYVNPTSSFLEQYNSFFNELFNQMGVPSDLVDPYLVFLNEQIKSNAQRGLDRKIEEGSEIPGHSEWRILHTFGHSQGHLSFMHPEEKILIGGDILLPHISPNPVIEPPLYIGAARTKPQIQLNHTLRRLYELPIQRVVPGHGEDITNHRELINLRLKRQHERAMKVRDYLMEGPKTAFEVSSRLFPKSYKSRLGFSLFETIGQLDYLLSLELIKEVRTKDGLLYTVSS